MSTVPTGYAVRAVPTGRTSLLGMGGELWYRIVSLTTHSVGWMEGGWVRLVVLLRCGARKGIIEMCRESFCYVGMPARELIRVCVCVCVPCCSVRQRI